MAPTTPAPTRRRRLPKGLERVARNLRLTVEVAKRVEQEANTLGVEETMLIENALRERYDLPTF